MAEIQEKAKSRPMLAYLIVGSIVLAAVLTIVEKIMSLLDRFGVTGN